MLFNRVIFDDNGTQTDYSHQLENFHGDNVALNYVAGEDKLYIGTDWPVNSFFFELDTVNASATSVAIRYHTGGQFKSAIEVIDETSSGGVSLAKSAHITLIPNRNNSIGRVDSTENMSEISQTIYSKYWYEITFSSDCSFTLKWLGQIYATDDDLESEHPDLGRATVKTAIESGKTDYKEQHIVAARRINEDLVSRNRLIHSGQILERRAIRSLAIAKSAELIYNMLGEDFEPQREKAAQEYQKRLSKNISYLDSNNNALLDHGEKSVSFGRMKR